MSHIVGNFNSCFSRFFSTFFIAASKYFSDDFFQNYVPSLFITFCRAAPKYISGDSALSPFSLNNKIRPQYAHECMYDRMTQKIQLFCLRKRKRTAVSVPANVDTCWRVPGVCTRNENHQADDGVNSMMNALDRDNAMLGRINLFGELDLLISDLHDNY